MGLSTYSLEQYKNRLIQLINDVDEREKYIINDCNESIDQETVVNNAKEFMRIFMITEVDIALELYCLNREKRFNTDREEYIRCKIEMYCGNKLNNFKESILFMKNTKLYTTVMEYFNKVVYMDKQNQLIYTIALYRELRMNEHYSAKGKSIRKELMVNKINDDMLPGAEVSHVRVFDNFYYDIRDLLTAIQELNILPGLNTRAPRRWIESKITNILAYKYSGAIVGFRINYINKHREEFTLNIITKKHESWADNLRESYQSNFEYNKNYIEKYIQNLQGTSKLKFE